MLTPLAWASTYAPFVAVYVSNPSSETMYYFLTSVNNAYLPKAITLAQSIRRVYGDQAHVTCMLSDEKPPILITRLLMRCSLLPI